MSWPLASHFSAMLQNPRVAFRDTELREYRVEKDGMNQPRPWAGAFAVVYKGLAPEGKPPRALRVFTTESPERRERYDLINEYLRSRRLKCLVDFEYRDNSIRATDGKWYPLIVMDWVEGSTLFHWARERALAGDGRELAKAAQHWVALVRELEEHQVAHGDLQHANVMVTPQGEVKLVDYDGMCVPALVGRRNLEVGVEPYQHPARNAETLLSLELDRFSALLIYVALRALAADPGLWKKYVDDVGHDKLLFRTEDFRAPDSSPLLHDLRHGSDREVAELVERLLESAREPLSQVPPLSVLTDSYAKLEQLLAQREWAAAVKWLNKRGRFRDAPEHLQTLIHEAYEHVCRSEAWEAIERIPRQESEICDRQLAVAWNEPLFADFAPAEAERPRFEQARRRAQLVDRLVELIMTDQNAVSLDRERKIVKLVSRLPDGYRHSYEARVQQAQRRVAAVAQFEAAATQEPIDEAGLAQAWQTLVEAGFSSLVETHWQPRAQLAAQRAPLLAALAALPESLPPDQFDRRLLALWKEDLLAECRQAAAWREAYATAVRRKEALGELQAALEAGQASAILALIDAPDLSGYPLPGAWKTVINGVRQKAAKVESLIDVVRQGRPAALLPLFDAPLIREYARQFAPYQKTLAAWTESEILPLDNLGLGPAIGRASLVAAPGAASAVRVRWNWPPARFSQECLVAVCAEEPTAGQDPAEIPALQRIAVNRLAWENAGGNLLVPIEPAWQGHYVAVWAQIDLGFARFFSHPLVLGRLAVRPAAFRRARPRRTV